MRASLGPVLVVALMLFAGSMLVWVIWQLTASGRPPQAFSDREPYPRCPPVTVAQGQASGQVSGEQAAAAPWEACLSSADAQHDGAEVRVTSATTEGDPIRTYYRRAPGGGGAEVFIDATADSFGSGEWEHLRCADVAALRTFEGCWAAGLLGCVSALTVRCGVPRRCGGSREGCSAAAGRCVGGD
ncbi:hypothetical protein [Kineococcus esterisolvens]|uniref:hypothetical protein n=1 Tax=unclassified Kineococcus TaxID=2621656 RepID=UPI003D7D50A6